LLDWEGNPPTGNPIEVRGEKGPSGDGDKPPTASNTVSTKIDPSSGSSKNSWTITITPLNGGPIPPHNTPFNYWFVEPTTTTNSKSIARGADPYGPFTANSITNSSGVATLAVTAASAILQGTYKVQYADDATGTTYVGTSSLVTVEKDTGDGGSGGGCTTGIGFAGFLPLLGGALLYRRKKSVAK
jgi:hypothetical protein